MTSGLAPTGGYKEKKKKNNFSPYPSINRLFLPPALILLPLTAGGRKTVTFPFCPVGRVRTTCVFIPQSYTHVPLRACVVGINTSKPLASKLTVPLSPFLCVSILKKSE